MNKNKLKGKIVERELTYRKIAELLGISETTFVSKVNGKTKFNIEEVKKISSILCLNEIEIIKIFLT